jgi:hypothetical protein
MNRPRSMDKDSGMSTAETCYLRQPDASVVVSDDEVLGVRMMIMSCGRLQAC